MWQRPEVPNGELEFLGAEVEIQPPPFKIDVFIKDDVTPAKRETGAALDTNRSNGVVHADVKHGADIAHDDAPLPTEIDIAENFNNHGDCAILRRCGMRGGTETYRRDGIPEVVGYLVNVGVEPGGEDEPPPTIVLVFVKNGFVVRRCVEPRAFVNLD